MATITTTTTTTANVKIMVTSSQKKLWGHLTQNKELKTPVQVQFKPNKIEEMIFFRQSFG